MPKSDAENILGRVTSLSSHERQILIAALNADDTERVVPRCSAYGKYAGRLTPVDDFLRLKHQETERDDSVSNR